jgi:hypothetical protein
MWRNLRDRFPHPYTPAEFIARTLAKDVDANLN